MDGAPPHAFVLFGDLPKIGPYLTELHARGLTILLVTGPPQSSLERRATQFIDNPDHPYSIIEQVRTMDGEDLEGILDQVRLWSSRYEIVGVLATTEIFVEAAGVVTDLLGLPGVSLRASRVCRNKFLQRRYLRRWSPPSTLVTGPIRAHAVEHLVHRLPLIVKPLTLWSSIGVQRFDDEKALRERLSALSLEDRVLVEEFVPGREFNADAIVVDGALVFSAITQKGTNEGTTSYFAELVHTFPPTNLNEDETRRVLAVHAEVIDRLGFGTGMAHAEYRVTDDGRVVLMEIAARPPGDGCLALYHLTTGHPVEAVLVGAALGEATPRPALPTPARRARQVYFEHDPGPLEEVTVDWPDINRPRWLADVGIWPPLRPGAGDDPPTLRVVMVLKERGEELEAITKSGARAVTAIFDASLGTDLDALDTRVRRAVAIRNDPPTASSTVATGHQKMASRSPQEKE